MKKRTQAPSKIPVTGTNTNRKRTPGPETPDTPTETAMFKKNEFSLIIFGALLLTLIVFFVFFRSSDKPEPGQSESVKKDVAATSFTDIEKRIAKLESMAAGKQITDKAGSAGSGVSNPLDARVSRLEAAFELKFDSLLDRMGKIEKRLADLKNAAAKVPAAKPAVPVKKPAVAKKSAADKKEQMFHTVKKGETLYSISKKYNLTVAQLRKLNKLSETAKIYPGSNLLIR